MLVGWREISQAETLHVLLELNRDRAPGSDGFLIAFWQFS